MIRDALFPVPDENEQDDLLVELAFLRQVLATSGPALTSEDLGGLDLMQTEVACLLELQKGGERPRYRRLGPALTKVAAVGIATFPAVLNPMPAFAGMPLPANMALTLNERPPTRLALAAKASEQFAFSAPMMAVQAQATLRGGALSTSQLFAFSAPMLAVQARAAQPGATASRLSPRLKAVFKGQRKVSVTTLRQAATTFYQVTKGDSLYSIASDLLGSGSRWREVYAANRDKVGPAFLLKPGQQLTIPAQRRVQEVQMVSLPSDQPVNSPASIAEPQGNARAHEVVAANRDRVGLTAKTTEQSVQPTAKRGEATLASLSPIQSGAVASAPGKPYLVSRGDSLYTIAAKRLGNGNRWREIVEMNKAALNGKTVIFPNQWLVLPTET